MAQDPKTAAKQVRAYLAGLPPDSRRVMKRVREDIRSAAPEAVDTFGYGIPGFRVDGRLLIWYAAWKEHVSFYPIGAKTVKALGADGSAKGTIRFPMTTPPSSAVVKRLVKLRIGELRKEHRA